jgi:beta-galactosidase/beta-glucuronidase
MDNSKKLVPNIRRSLLDLSGHWRFCIADDPDFSRADLDDASWETMFIPQNWFLAGVDQHGVVWFRVEFEYFQPREYATLHIDGVDYFAEVYLNGQLLGRHTGYFEPFAFEIGTVLKPGKNILAVRVESPFEKIGLDGWHLHKKLIKGVLNHHDCRPGGGWEETGQSFNTGGIWNRVYIEGHGPVTIDGMLLHADIDNTDAILYVELTILNRDENKTTNLEIRCTPDNFEGETTISKFDLNLPPGKSIHSLQVCVTDVKHWQPWDRGFPHLYTVLAELNLEEGHVFSSSLFGYRKVKVEEGFHWLINHHPYFVRGSNYLPSQWLSETLFPEAAINKLHPFGGGPGADLYSRDVALAKQANLNLLRVHAHVLPEEFHAACDRAGMLVWQDFPLQWGYSDDVSFHVEAERQIRAMVTSLYNHPSIVAWCCHNESPCDAPWMAGAVGGLYDPAHNRDLDAKLETAIRKLDTSRFIQRNSGTGDGHVYPGWYVGRIRDFINLPGAPFITEYGAQGLPALESIQRMLPQYGSDSGHAELVRFKEWLDSLHRISSTKKVLLEFGNSMWNFLEKMRWKSIQNWVKGFGMKLERSSYKTIPPIDQTPQSLLKARQVWETWQFHDFQPAETFDNGIDLGSSLEEFVTNSQAYQAALIQYATECYRLAKYKQVTGIMQFDLTDPWPAVTWSVLDYWRKPKSAYEALQRSMQPVLPSFQLPERIKPHKAIPIFFRVVNDLETSYPASTCAWNLSNETGILTDAAFKIDIPADSVSEKVKIKLPALVAGRYKLNVNLDFGTAILGQNQYEIVID